MDSKKKRLLIAVVLLFLILLLVLLWPKKKSEPVVNTETPVTSPAETNPEPSLVAPLVKRETPTPTQVNAEAVARTFAERFSSFSAESHFANVQDLYPLMTSAFRKQQEALIAEAVASEDYYGVTSKLVSLTTTSFTESRAVMDAALQRVESRGSATSSTKKYETLHLTLVFENGTWLVSGADWSKE